MSEWNHLYNNEKWRRFRVAYLNRNPLCVNCLKNNKANPATVVDHIEPHKGDLELFWNSDNYQALCANCHSSWKQRKECNAHKPEIGIDGWKK